MGLIVIKVIASRSNNNATILAPPRLATVATGDSAFAVHPGLGGTGFFYFLHGDDECEIAARHDVGTAKRHQKINIRCPRADTFDLYQLGADCLVIHFLERGKIELTIEDGLRKITTVCYFLPTESDGLERRVTQLKEAMRR